MTMTRTGLTLLLAVIAAAGWHLGQARGQTEEPSLPRLQSKIGLGNVRGRIDHLAVDLLRQHLFVAELGNNSVGIVDLDRRKLLRRIGGLKEPQGIGYVAATDTLYVANGGDGSVHLFHAEDFAPSGHIELGKDADNVRVDPGSNSVFVGYGAGGLAQINPVDLSTLATIALPAHPEGFQLEHGGEQIFVNLPSARSIAVIDRTSKRQRASWSTGENRGNFAMALDQVNQRVIVIFRDPPKLGVFAMKDGVGIAERDTCGDADDVFFAESIQHIYVVCGEGFIDVFDPGAGYRRLGRLATVSGARTGLLIPQLKLLVLAVRASGGEDAAIWLYQVAP